MVLGRVPDHGHAHSYTSTHTHTYTCPPMCTCHHIHVHPPTCVPHAPGMHRDLIPFSSPQQTDLNELSSRLPPFLKVLLPVLLLHLERQPRSQDALEGKSAFESPPRCSWEPTPLLAHSDNTVMGRRGVGYWVKWSLEVWRPASASLVALCPPLLPLGHFLTLPLVSREALSKSIVCVAQFFCRHGAEQSQVRLRCPPGLCQRRERLSSLKMAAWTLGLGGGLSQQRHQHSVWQRADPTLPGWLVSRQHYWRRSWRARMEGEVTGRAGPGGEGPVGALGCALRYSRPAGQRRRRR